MCAFSADSAGQFEGKFYRGTGDVEYLKLLDTARRMFDADPEYQNMPMLYTPAWNGLVEGPTWGAWWIQNSYGTTYCALPFYQEPFTTFLQNSQDLWFDQMGDGKREGANKWVAPDGCLCDAASPGWIYYRQGDGRIDIHDWGMEFTAAGLLMQAELLLISRDEARITHYLPRLERCANFIETRRDPKNNLFLAGPAGNLLAPSYAGYKKPDGTYGMAYLTGLSVTYIAALDRLIELERVVKGLSPAEGASPPAPLPPGEGRTTPHPLAPSPRVERGRTADGKGPAEDKVALYTQRRDLARKGLAAATEAEGYLIRSIDPDGVKHGVFGAKEHGYFEASPNHDAICFRVTDDVQSEKIMAKIDSIPGLRPHDFIIPNYPSYDDMYEQPAGLWGFGTWVNGGHWSTCEARMMMAYARLGKYEDARRSMKQLMTFARRFRMDNPLTESGGNVYQPNEPVNLCYDTFGPAAGLVRGLFEYLYRADGLTLVPHIPPGIKELEQLFPIRYGKKSVYLTVAGTGHVTGVKVNGKAWTRFDKKSVFLPYEATPDEAHVTISLGGAKASAPRGAGVPPAVAGETPAPRAAPRGTGDVLEWYADLQDKAGKLRGFGTEMDKAGLGGTYEAAHARLIVQFVEAIRERRAMKRAGLIAPLPEASEAAADQSYTDTATKLYAGLQKVISGYAHSDDKRHQKVFALWRQFGDAPGWFNIRSGGATQSFAHKGTGLRMSIDGKKDASCGWEYSLTEAFTIPKGAKLVLEISGSPGAKHFVDLMSPEGKVIAQTMWQPTPAEAKVETYNLPEGAQVGQFILYTMTPEGKAWNEFGRVEIIGEDGKVVLNIAPGAGK